MNKVAFAREMSRAMLTDLRSKPYVEQLVAADPTGIALSKEILFDVTKGIEGGARYKVVFPNIFSVIARHLDWKKLPRQGAGLGQFDWGALVGSVITAGSQFAAASIKAQTDMSINKMTIQAQQAEAERQRQAQLQALALQAQLANQPPALPPGATPPSQAGILGGLPSWALPVGLGVVGLLAFVAFKPKSKK